VTRTISISLPEELLRQAESLAKAESRTMSELFREALRAYRVQRVRQQLRDDREYARSLPATAYTEADVEQMVKEDRAERARTARSR
jgi:metal-responsive CopG/Arc/MetJ family transcriptional regulator